MELRQRIKNVLVGADQFFGTVVTLGSLWPDETLSSYAYRLDVNGKRGGRIFRPAIDAIFFWQTEHCRQSYEEERMRYQFPPELR